jgi:hypothetical protein
MQHLRRNWGRVSAVLTLVSVGSLIYKKQQRNLAVLRGEKTIRDAAMENASDAVNVVPGVGHARSAHAILSADGNHYETAKNEYPVIAAAARQMDASTDEKIREKVDSEIAAAKARGSNYVQSMGQVVDASFHELKKRGCTHLPGSPDSDSPF